MLCEVVVRALCLDTDRITFLGLCDSTAYFQIPLNVQGVSPQDARLDLQILPLTDGLQRTCVRRDKLEHWSSYVR